MFIAELFAVAEMETSKCPLMDEWIKKMCCISQLYIYEYSAIKKKILPFVITQMNFEGIILSEVSRQKDRYYMISVIFGISNKLQRQENRLMVARDGVKGQANELRESGTNFQLQIKSWDHNA